MLAGDHGADVDKRTKNEEGVEELWLNAETAPKAGHRPRRWLASSADGRRPARNRRGCAAHDGFLTIDSSA